MRARSRMVEMLEHFEDPAAGADKVESYEHIGDTITHEIMTRLNQTFITPFDREDIHELASKIDDVIDLVDAAATRMVTYRVKTIRPGVMELAKTVRVATAQIVAAVRRAGQGRSHPRPLHRNQPAGKSGGPAVPRFDRRRCSTRKKIRSQIIKWKEIIETLEFATDKCEDVANVIETVTLKNA